ncbi:MAG TPA: cupin domain-containing protein [Xanthobacteraceae bacterium]
MSVAALDAVDQLRQAWQQAHLVPLWESPTAHKPPAPPDPAYLWAWERIRPLIGRAIEVADPAAVERRVLSLVNPRSRGPHDEATARTLAAAIQILLPGERARPHRHSMNAVRFVLEGSGAFTIVDGKSCPMEVGDLILTPAWCWHEHVHRGSAPIIWLDALDVPLHLYLGTAEFQSGPVTDLPETVPDSYFAVANVVPDIALPSPVHSPVFRYPYQSAAAALTAAPPARDGARRVRYVNPATGGAAMTILDMHLMQLDPGVTTRPLRTTSNAVVNVVEGSGESQVGGQTVRWQAKDIFTLPQGNRIVHRSNDGARLFVVSDRDALARLGLLRDEYGNDAGSSG